MIVAAVDAGAQRYRHDAGFATDAASVQMVGPRGDPNPFFQKLMTSRYLNNVIISPHICALRPSRLMHPPPEQLENLSRSSCSPAVLASRLLVHVQTRQASRTARSTRLVPVLRSAYLARTATSPRRCEDAESFVAMSCSADYRCGAQHSVSSCSFPGLLSFVVLASPSDTTQRQLAGLHIQGQEACLQGGAGRVRLAPERPAQLVLQQRLSGDGPRGASSAALTGVACAEQAMLTVASVGSTAVIHNPLQAVGQLRGIATRESILCH